MHNTTAGLLAGSTLADVMSAIQKAEKIADPLMPDSLAKSTFSQSGSAITGLTFYDLEAGAKYLYPVLTPLRNSIPRVSGKGGTEANWRAVTGVNTSNVSISVSGGNRGGLVAVTTANYIAAYKGIGLESSVDFEAQYAGQNFDDVRAIAVKTLLESVMLGEEKLLLGGNTGVQYGTCPTPALVGSTTGGTLAAGTWYVYCVALSLDGYTRSTVAAGVTASITRTNVDGSSDTFGGGAGQISAAATVVTTGSTSSISASVAPTRGALAYAWYWGITGASTAYLGAITTAPAVSITTAATGTQTASSMPAADNSTNTLAFDGLLTQALNSNSNAYWADLGGATLTADGEAGIVQIDAALKYMWDNFRLGPDDMWVNSQQALNISQKILQGASNGAYRVVFSPEQGMVAGGIMATTYLNRFSMEGAKTVTIKIHPNMPPGTILFVCNKLPYPVTNIGNLMQVRARQDYYQIEWPLVSRKYQYGVYADEVLQHYAPFSMAVITGIGAG